MTFEQEIVSMRRYIHQNPELGGNEYNTAEFIECKLKELKIACKRLGDTGVMGTITGSRPGKTIALRADMDALPIVENNDVKYKSISNGIMHACGHDAHVAIMLGAAKLLQEKKNELNGNVRFIFQPSEEISNGAKGMIKKNALKNPDVDFILGVHVSPWLKSGKIGLKFGAMMAAVDDVKIEILGETAHGAYPHCGKDALVAAAAFINVAQCIVSREVDPLESAVVTFGKIEGGSASNVICKKVTINGTIRTLDDKILNLIKANILKKLKGIEISYDVKCIARFDRFASPLINTSWITEACAKTAKEFYGKDNVEILEKPSMGGEDFAEYLHVVPGNFVYIGTSKDEYTSYPWHHSNFDIDETALPSAAKYVTYTVCEFLKSD